MFSGLNDLRSIVSLREVLVYDLSEELYGILKISSRKTVSEMRQALIWRKLIFPLFKRMQTQTIGDMT